MFNCQVNSVEILNDVSASGKVRPWAMYKKQNEKIAKCYEYFDAKKAARVKNCSQVLVFGATADGRKKLKKADFCRVRLCPICQWRRSLKNFGQIQKILKEIEGKYKYLFLTLTLRNCTADELSGEITHILNAFNRMTDYKAFKDGIKGYYRGLEVTHNTVDDTFHPHIHVLLAVSTTYFTKYYINQQQYTELWKKALKVEYTPIVDVRRVKGTNAKAIAEVAKYSCKPSEILYYDDWAIRAKVLQTIDSALERRRLIAYGGILKELHKKLNLEDVEDGDLADIGEGDGETVTDNDIIFVWHTGYSQYVKQ